MKKINLFILLLFVIQIACGQNSKKAYRENFLQGNYLILEQNYTHALRYFKEAYKIDSSSANINYKLGLCYLQSPSEKNFAARYLEKAVLSVTHNYSPEDATEKRAPVFAYYSLGEAYRLNYNFIASYFYFKKFKDIVGNKNSELAKDLDQQLQINTNAQEFVKDTAKVVLVNLGDSINSPFPDYSPVISADESTLIFTSRRPGSTGGEKTDDDQFFEDIYFSNKKKDVAGLLQNQLVQILTPLVTMAIWDFRLMDKSYLFTGMLMEEIFIIVV